MAMMTFRLDGEFIDRRDLADALRRAADAVSQTPSHTYAGSVVGGGSWSIDEDEIEEDEDLDDDDDFWDDEDDYDDDYDIDDE